FHFALLTSASRDDPENQPCCSSLPQGPNPKCGTAPEIRFIPCLCWRILRPSGLQQSRTVPAIVRRNSVTAYAAAPPAPTAASEIFTPGPMVDEMEIFFT